MKRTAPLSERFLSRINKTPNCWEWIGELNKDGYGRFLVKETQKYWMVHRLALSLVGIRIPKNKVVDHICRNRKCVNPEHLRIVTPYENIMDERSLAMGRLNKEKTHCVRGHEFEKVGYYLIATSPYKKDRTSRVCKECNRIRGRLTSHTYRRKMKGKK